MVKKKEKKDVHKLHIIGHVDKNVNFNTRLDAGMSKWIDDNTTGSKNSIINYFVRLGVEEHKKLLLEQPIFKEL